MVDDEPQSEGDLRRRAAWLLGMLALVAVLFVVVMSTVLGGGSGSGPKRAIDSGPLDGTISSSSGSSTARPAPSTSQAGSSATGSAASSSAPRGRASCPTQDICALDGDIGDAVAAINAYRSKNGQKPVPGSVSEAAKKCALTNGSGCSGGWAESQVPGPDGAAAVAKILQFGKLLDPSMTSVGVGWAYDPGSKQYYFAIVRNS